MSESTLETVRKMLESVPATRDDSLLLYREIVYKLRGGADIRLSALCHDIYNGLLPSPETVARLSRLCQLEDPKLRGTEYASRKERQEHLRKYFAHPRLDHGQIPLEL